MSFAACVGRQMVSRHTMFLQSSPISKHSIRHGRDAFVEVVMPSQSVFCYHSLDTDHRNAPAGPAGAPAVTTLVCSCDAGSSIRRRASSCSQLFNRGSSVQPCKRQGQTMRRAANKSAATKKESKEPPSGQKQHIVIISMPCPMCLSDH